MAFKAAGKMPNVGVLSEQSAIWEAGQLDIEVEELIELIYVFEEPLVLDGSKFSTKFPLFKYTPHEEGIKKAIHWYLTVGSSCRFQSWIIQPLEESGQTRNL